MNVSLTVFKWGIKNYCSCVKFKGLRQKTQTDNLGYQKQTDLVTKTNESTDLAANTIQTKQKAEPKTAMVHSNKVSNRHTYREFKSQLNKPW